MFTLAFGFLWMVSILPSSLYCLASFLEAREITWTFVSSRLVFISLLPGSITANRLANFCSVFILFLLEPA
jgi:hypothetical protein